VGEPFKGTINVDIRDSVPDWAPFEPPKAPDGAPSVVYIVLDDVGFSAMGCYGGPIETPNIDRIAAEGVAFTQWHTTALCSPTRKSPEEGYHFTEDITDKAIEFIKDAKAVAPDKPFFLYYAPGAAHAPHHAPREWIDRYRGRFDLGYEAIREQILARQRQMGIVPANTELPPLNPIGTADPHGSGRPAVPSAGLHQAVGFPVRPRVRPARPARPPGNV
jgi:arylsulfatase A-like enzyme